VILGITDAYVLKHGYRMGLGTPVVHALTYACYMVLSLFIRRRVLYK